MPGQRDAHRRDHTGIQASGEFSWIRARVRQRFWEPHLLTVLFLSHSGVIGSGLCVFSRFPILDTLLYQYSLNGYPYMVSEVGGTVGVHRASVALTCPSSPWAAPAWGLVLWQVRRSCRYEDLRDHLQCLRHPSPRRVLPGQGRLPAPPPGAGLGAGTVHPVSSCTCPPAGPQDVCSHPCPWGLHCRELPFAPAPVRNKAEEHWAGPSRCSLVPGRAGKDSHPCAHRHTSKAADVVLLGGDLNMHPEDVGIRLLRGWTGLRDAFAEAMRFEGCKNGCTLVPDNCFTDKSEMLPFPLGIRIDYILYKAISSFTVKCEELKTTTGPAPGMAIPFSDHEAVMATLHIQRQGQPAGATLGTAGKLRGCCQHPLCAGGWWMDCWSWIQFFGDIHCVLGGWWMDCWSWIQFFGDISPCGGLQSGGDGEKGMGVVWGGVGMVYGGPSMLRAPVPADLALADVVTEARTEVGVGLRAAQRQRYSWGRMAVLALLLLLLQAAAALGTLAGLGAEQPFPKLSFCLLAFLSLAILVVATGLHIFHTMEVKMLHGTEDQMWMALRALQERPSEG
uniref:Sphingomyelin phosphodiesterase 2 n=1 Tax=Ficedula albicollis TaxID=59894 RepID=A0A803VER4_FICAL